MIEYIGSTPWPAPNTRAQTENEDSGEKFCEMNPAWQQDHVERISTHHASNKKTDR
jgi:hypothetical protein